MVEAIKKKLKELGITQKSFCKKVGVAYKDFSTRFKGFEKQVDKINIQLESVGLELKLIDKAEDYKNGDR